MNFLSKPINLLLIAVLFSYVTFVAFGSREILLSVDPNANFWDLFFNGLAFNQIALYLFLPMLMVQLVMNLPQRLNELTLIRYGSWRRASFAFLKDQSAKVLAWVLLFCFATAVTSFGRPISNAWSSPSLLRLESGTAGFLEYTTPITALIAFIVTGFFAAVLISAIAIVIHMYTSKRWVLVLFLAGFWIIFAAEIYNNHPVSFISPVAILLNQYAMQYQIIGFQIVFELLLALVIVFAIFKKDSMARAIKTRYNDDRNLRIYQILCVSIVAFLVAVVSKSFSQITDILFSQSSGTVLHIAINILIWCGFTIIFTSQLNSRLTGYNLLELIRYGSVPKWSVIILRKEIFYGVSVILLISLFPLISILITSNYIPSDTLLLYLSQTVLNGTLQLILLLLITLLVIYLSGEAMYGISLTIAILVFSFLDSSWYNPFRHSSFTAETDWASVGVDSLILLVWIALAAGAGIWATKKMDVPQSHQKV